MRATTPQPPATVRVFTQRFSSTRRGARLARLLAVHQLTEWDVPSDNAEAIVAELAANAVLHGRVPGRDFELRLTLRTAEGVLRIEVTDTHPERQLATGPASPEGEHGRGLLIVSALADRWGVEPGPAPRKTVWADVNCPR
ncbi:ATP-binding protein [Streptomyces sp. NBC_00878]|uniref:ATP-binding protein n=1 Tax=Streptomyces sp. NBC_00878 TaxID=2975854 RepID=UPI00224D8F98|nr:ATP-binding protein [Streptomyces sp. NBC_00878]MCX4904681.1 ATP-binding protein [Streptomyces sp. NBC_00878]